MFRKIIFSKEPTALSMESMDPIVRLQMKNNKEDIFSLEGSVDTFSIKKGINELSRSLLHLQLNSNQASLTTDSIISKQLQTPELILQQYSLQDANEKIIKGLQNDIAGIKYILPSRFHTHRFLTRTGEGTYNEWVRIQQGRKGQAQVGIGTNILDPLSSLHVNGIIRCDQIITSSSLPSQGYTLNSNAVYLDSNGKIPFQYLPEQYKVSIIQNDAGVGIGTKTPFQKLHVEGGSYIRDRLAIGQPNPNAILHISQDANMLSLPLPGLKIQQDTGKAIEITDNLDKSFFSVSSDKTLIGPGIGNPYNFICKGNLETQDVHCEDIVIQKEGVKRFETNTDCTTFYTSIVSNKELVCSRIESPLDTSNIQLYTKNIDAENATLLIQQTNIALPTSIHTVQNSRIEGNGLLEEMNYLEPILYKNIDNTTNEFKYTFMKDDIVQKITEGNEIASLLMDSNHRLNETSMIHILWKAVKQLSQRVKDLEGQKS